MNKFEEKIEKIFLENSSIVLASLVSAFGDLSLAEDLLQEAFLIAYEKWNKEGFPPNPVGWLTLTAKRKAIDKFRREKIFDNKVEIIKQQISSEMVSPDNIDFEEIPDERLKLMFTCCHPSLSVEAQIALTLHTLGGLSTEEISNAFLVPTATLAQRLVRAKQKIKVAGIPYRVPPIKLLPERLDSLLHVLYLIFNEGYNASLGSHLIRKDLSEEAIRLLRILVALIRKEESIPNTAEAIGLLAMMLLHDSRKDARVDKDGNLVVLDEQDHQLWDQDKIKEGLELLDKAMLQRATGPYQIQAAISALHAQTSNGTTTDWVQISALYEKLYSLSNSPIVSLNHAVAISKSIGLEEGIKKLALLKNLKEIINYPPYYIAWAEMHAQLGNKKIAIEGYNRALSLNSNEISARHIQKKLIELQA